ncbi:DNA polymerase III subunit beta [Helicobacter turcicus]|uniref:Beta sliding clamp n=1 Tax=Helicobacter turcicus TaxID=2867412 RepID=A0ABS7JPW5_9HELI|nr:DNA polymerase III subunit beta [Helicobacter turcicus]MBX7491455.1 DNA polymerase III subunit beta [Helicobacter turcicus]MBX7545914.1 DNA polymerase III subunit beta [Helicobacter turcicus]
MNITIPNSVLDNIFTSLQPFLDKKDSSQITSHIYLETRNNQLITKATDFEMGLCAITDSLNIKEEGIATVNGKQILDIIKRLKEGDVNLYTNNENLHIKQNKSSFKLPMFNAQEFPTFPEFENLPKLEINSLELITSMKKIFPVIDMNNQKRELNGALLDIKEYSYNFVATDTKRLAMVKFDKPSGKNLSLIFPRKAITEIQRLFFDNVELFYNEKNVVIKSQNYIFFCYLINGKFPDYEKILPKEMQIELNIPKSNIIEGVKVINSVTNDVKITFRAHEILFESLSQDNSEAKTQIEIELPINEEIEIGINSRHILDFLTQIDTATFTWSLNGKNAPFVLKSGNFSTVVMPIII